MKPLHFRLASGALWCALLGVAIFTAPPGSPDTGKLITHLATGQLEGVNLSLFALFNLMGVWPVAMAVALRFDGPWWKWVFLVVSFGLGAFALLPYFMLRPWLEPRREPTSFVGRFLSSRWVLRALVLAAVCFGALFVFGGLNEFGTLFRTQQFAYVMSFDFFAFCGAALLLGLERSVSATTG
ncbi:MAG: hypothetical protein Q8L48_28530 [Archangium sp.]|nr:hypothetical protein [Archangium sp.]